MKAKWIDDVGEILDSQAFQVWLGNLENARRELRVATEKHDELLTQVNLLDFRAELVHRRAIDTLEQANVLEDESVQLGNEAASLENHSFEAVAQYEMQRTKTTELWQRLGAIEVEAEEASDPAQKKKLEKQREKLNLDYEREDAKKQKLWAEVERLWVRNIDKSLELREKRRKAQIVRAEAEDAFAKHEAESGQAQELRAKAEHVAAERETKQRELTATYQEARERFDCLLHQDFLYWSAREDNKVVYAVPLIADTRNYVVELKPGRLYKCPHDKGVEALERITEVRSVRPKGAEATDALAGASSTSDSAPEPSSPADDAAGPSDSADDKQKAPEDA